MRQNMVDRPRIRREYPIALSTHNARQHSRNSFHVSKYTHIKMSLIAHDMSIRPQPPLLRLPGIRLRDLPHMPKNKAGVGRAGDVAERGEVGTDEEGIKEFVEAVEEEEEGKEGGERHGVEVGVVAMFEVERLQESLS